MWHHKCYITCSPTKSKSSAKVLMFIGPNSWLSSELNRKNLVHGPTNPGVLIVNPQHDEHVLIFGLHPSHSVIDFPQHRDLENTLWFLVCIQVTAWQSVEHDKSSDCSSTTLGENITPTIKKYFKIITLLNYNISLYLSITL
jgi:hypothetical protein